MVYSTLVYPFTSNSVFFRLISAQYIWIISSRFVLPCLTNKSSSAHYRKDTQMLHLFVCEAKEFFPRRASCFQGYVLKLGFLYEEKLCIPRLLTFPQVNTLSRSFCFGILQNCWKQTESEDWTLHCASSGLMGCVQHRPRVPSLEEDTQ